MNAFKRVVGNSFGFKRGGREKLAVWFHICLHLLITISTQVQLKGKTIYLWLWRFHIQKKKIAIKKGRLLQTGWHITYSINSERMTEVMVSTDHIADQGDRLLFTQVWHAVNSIQTRSTTMYRKKQKTKTNRFHYCTA